MAPWNASLSPPISARSPSMRRVAAAWRCPEAPPAPDATSAVDRRSIPGRRQTAVPCVRELKRGHHLRIPSIRFVTAPARLTADEARGDLRARRHRTPRLLRLDRAHRPVSDLLERLRDRRERRVSQAREQQIVEAGHRDVLGHAAAMLAQDVDGAGRHLVVRRHDAVDLHAPREDLLHRELGRVGAEIARGRQGRIAGDAVAGEHRLVGVEPALRLGVLRRPRQKRDLAAAVIADEVLDHGLHAGPVVEHQARHARQIDADAAHRRAGEPLDQSGDPAWTGVRGQQR